MNYWLVKSEPFKYSFDQLVEDGSTVWDGVRNYQARNNLAAMTVGDRCLYYHSNEGKAIVGIATVSAAAFPDPTVDDERWLAVELMPVNKLSKEVTLAQLKATPELATLALLRQPRLSVLPVTKAEYDRVVELGGGVL